MQLRPAHNFTKLANEWPLPGLSAVDRKLIEAELFMADAVFHAEDADMDRVTIAHLKPMAQVFTKTAEVLFNANLLTVQLLENELRLLVVEAAVAGNWFQSRFPTTDRVEIFPGYFGHASVWEHVNISYRAVFANHVFSVGIAEWTGKLLAREAEEMRSAPESKQERNVDEEQERRAKLLAEYKAATNNPSNKRIYEARNSRIHKPDFYAWLKGALPSNSATAVNFERFLREKKAPTPKNT